MTGWPTCFSNRLVEPGNMCFSFLSYRSTIAQDCFYARILQLPVCSSNPRRLGRKRTFDVYPLQGPRFITVPKMLSPSEERKDVMSHYQECDPSKNRMNMIPIRFSRVDRKLSGRMKDAPFIMPLSLDPGFGVVPCSDDPLAHSPVFSPLFGRLFLG